jgi:hypothetical protein
MAVVARRVHEFLPITQADVLREPHRDLLDAGRTLALTEELSIVRPEAQQHPIDPVIDRARNALLRSVSLQDLPLPALQAKLAA